MSDQWSTRLRKFEMYIVSSGIEDDDQKQALLLHVVGDDRQNIFETLEDTGTSFDHAKAKLTAHVAPKRNVTFQRHLFGKEDKTQTNCLSVCGPSKKIGQLWRF